MEQDALLTQLLAMGFDIEEIECCQVAMATSSAGSSRMVGSGTVWVYILEVNALLIFV